MGRENLGKIKISQVSDTIKCRSSIAEKAEPVARRAAGFARERLMLVSIRQQFRLAIWCPRGPRGSGITQSPGAATAGVTSAPKSPGAAEPH